AQEFPHGNLEPINYVIDALATLSRFLLVGTFFALIGVWSSACHPCPAHSYCSVVQFGSNLSNSNNSQQQPAMLNNKPTTE
ncbi:MAG: hypothetical protein WBD13_07770, partial [Burkholderiaceae bacterium]